MRGLKVLFAAGIHARDITSDAYISKLAHILGTSEADILLLGGDYGESKAATKRFLSALGEYSIPMGIYGVIGNNDAEAFEKIEELKDAFPGKLLINQMVEMPLRRGRLMIGGLDEISYGCYPEKSLFPIARDSYSILLSHYPSLHKTVSGARARLMLSGHTHGGQFRLLGLDPYSIGYERGYIDSVRGMSMHGPTRLFVSNGIGVSKLPLRIGCESQIHIFEFL